MRTALERLRRPGEEAPPLSHLHVGEYRVVRGPAVLYTLLGSCVAVCLFDAAARAGGMNHILLPGRSRGGGRRQAVSRFAHDAVELLVAELVAAGASRRRLAAKLFGGGHVISRVAEESSPGALNARFVLALMQSERIPVIASDLGGRDARKVWFRTDTAEVLLKRVPIRLLPGVRREESQLRRHVLGAGGAGLHEPGVSGILTRI